MHAIIDLRSRRGWCWRLTSTFKPKSATVAKTDVTPKPSETPKREPKIEEISDEKLQQLHKNEDRVLAENKLPKPSSEQQAQVRKRK